MVCFCSTGDCYYSEWLKWNISRVIPRLCRWVYKTLRLFPLTVEHSVGVITAGFQSRRSQTESYGQPIFNYRSRLCRWVYKTLRLFPLTVEHSVGVITAGFQSRRSQTESYGQPIFNYRFIKFVFRISEGIKFWVPSWGIRHSWS